MIVQLRAGDLLRLRKARFTKVEVRSGRVWITEEGRAGDHLLGPGNRYRVQGDGLVLVGTERYVEHRPAAELVVTPYEEVPQAATPRLLGTRRLHGELA